MMAPPRGYGYGVAIAMAAASLITAAFPNSRYPATRRGSQKPAAPSSNRKAELLEKALRRQARAAR